jgi:hypothetical protein
MSAKVPPSPGGVPPNPSHAAAEALLDWVSLNRECWESLMKFVVAAFALLVSAGASWADDPQQKSGVNPFGYAAPAPPANGFYVWSGSAYQSVGLPRYNLGPSTQIGPASVYGGQIVNFDPRAAGYSVSGGLGYALPSGTLPSALGQNVRVEFGGSYIEATATNSGSLQYPTPSGGGANFILLNNTQVFPENYGCIGICNTASTLTSHYADWQFSGKIVSDFTQGALTLSPSLSVFGGDAHNDQSFVSSTNNGFSPVDFSIYSANTNMRWIDWGLKSGLDMAFDATRAIRVGLGGAIGIADRNAQLVGSDLFVDTPYSLASTIKVNTTKAAFLGNVEASLEYRPWRNVTLRTFAGLNFDNSVPGIQAPTYNATAIIPASIKFQGETSYFLGGSVVVAFGP